MREYVAPERLREILNERLSLSEDCSRAELTTPPRRSPDGGDDTGCNWSPDLNLSLRGDNVRLCAQELDMVRSWARARYNLLSKWGSVEDLDFLPSLVPIHK